MIFLFFLAIICFAESSLEGTKRAGGKGRDKIVSSNSSAATAAAACAGRSGSFFLSEVKNVRKMSGGLSQLIRIRISSADGNRIINCPSRSSRSLLGNVIGDFFMEGGK